MAEKEGIRRFMDNRDRLMQCAKELFYEKGYDAVGVQEIVERASVTKPTLYYYFGSKIGLLETLLETRFAELDLLIGRTESTDNDIRGVLYRLAGAYCDFFERDREFYMLMMALFYSARGNEAYQVIKPYLARYFYENVVEIFDRAKHQLGNMNGRQSQFATGFVGTVNHFLLIRYEIDAQRREKIDARQVKSLVDQYMYGIFT